MKENHAHFAALEPSWFHSLTATELAGLLNLGLLLNEVVYLNDTQLGDNPHLFHSYINSRDDPKSLYGRVLSFARARILRIMLRDKIYLPASDKEYSCQGMNDVYRGWMEQGLPDAWVLKDFSEHREAYIDHLDSLLESAMVIRYPYRSLKHSFMEKLRSLLFTTGGQEINLRVQNLPQDVIQKYYEIVDRDWFSHSDLYSLLRSSGLALNDTLINIHGLLDEECYADAMGSGLLGCDVALTEMEKTLWDTHVGVQQIEFPTSLGHAEVLEYATRVLESPSLGLLGILSPEEVMELREKGSKLFAVLSFAGDDLAENLVENLRNNYIDSLVEYWGIICDHLVEKYPTLAMTRNRLGVFTRDKLPKIPDFARNLASITINLALNLIPTKTLNKAVNELRRDLLDKLSLKLLLFSETGPMKTIRHALPNRSWMTNRWTEAKTRNL